jgi:hypothetical protein
MILAFYGSERQMLLQDNYRCSSGPEVSCLESNLHAERVEAAVCSVA